MTFLKQNYLTNGHMVAEEKNEPATALWRDWGFRMNLKMVLYLENLCLTEKSRLFIPQSSAKTLCVIHHK
ncbi:hypothetical protein EAG11_04930 [Flavobacterium sp. 140616W15]|nr:hypothetical protein EAG11_04930 [Flavobacterium sp. 140616W15]